MPRSFVVKNGSKMRARASGGHARTPGRPRRPGSARPRRRHRSRHAAAARARLDRVEHDVDEDLLDLLGVDAQAAGTCFAVLDCEDDARAFGLRAEEADHAAQ